MLEYVALSTSMPDVIYFMNPIDEMKTFGIHLPQVPKPNTTCRVFEDSKVSSKIVMLALWLELAS